MDTVTIGSMQFYSRALESTVPYTVLLPDAQTVGAGPYPVLLQLHGYYDNHTAWLTKSNLLNYVQKLPVIVVLPAGGDHFWCDESPRARYEEFIVQDLWTHINAVYPVRPASLGERRWAIGGLSMGGFGALRLGLKHPDKFCSIFAHSSVIPAAEELAHWPVPITPDVQANMDCYALAERTDPATLPRLSFDCGEDDMLVYHNRRFHDHLTALQLPHSYAEHPGAHTWDYWDKHVQTALKQHGEVLGFQPVLRSEGPSRNLMPRP